MSILNYFKIELQWLTSNYISLGEMRFLTLCCPFQVPLLDASNLGLIKPNTLVQFRGMVQDILGNEFYAGAFKVLTCIITDYCNA